MLLVERHLKILTDHTVRLVHEKEACQRNCDVLVRQLAQANRFMSFR